MTQDVSIALPKLGESIVSATVVRWFKKVGDAVALDEPLVEVSTDKVNSEIPSPVAGILKEICALPDKELQVGEKLAVVSTSDAPSLSSQVMAPKSGRATQDSSMGDFFSPALIRLAREHKITMEELEKIATSGSGGRLTKRDLEEYIEKKGPLKTSSLEVERVKMSGMRKAIAENMVRSFYEAPHASLVIEVDVTEIVNWLAREKGPFLAKHGCKITITSFVAHAIASALEEYPLLNASLEQDTIVVKKFVNLGIAVSVDQGIVVPVIKQCQRLDLIAIAKALAELALKVREGKLSPDDVAGGTITMTNFGMSGVLLGMPIIRFPEVAIIGIGAIHKKAAVLEGDRIAVRSAMHVSLTFDHRVLDGMYGCGFLGALKKRLESTPLPLSG